MNAGRIGWTALVLIRVIVFGLMAVMAMNSGCSPFSEFVREKALLNAEEKLVRLYIWADYISPDVVNSFQEKTGIKVEITTFDTQEEEIGHVWSSYGQYDVVVAEDAVLDLFRELGLLQSLDLQRLPNIVNVDSTFRCVGDDAVSLDSVPYHWGTVVMAYRRDRTGDLTATWDVIWDKRFEGRIWLLRDIDELIALARIKTGFHRGDLGSNELARIRDLVLEQSRLVARFADTLSIAHALADGDCDIGVLYNGDAARAAAQNTNIVYVIPEEGAPLWVDNLCLLRDAEHPYSAHKFINFLLDGSVAAANANYVRFATPNAAARSELDPLLLNDLQVYLPPDLFKRCVFYKKPDAALLQLESALRAELSGLPAWRQGEHSHRKTTAVADEAEGLP